MNELFELSLSKYAVLVKEDFWGTSRIQKGHHQRPKFA